MTHQLKLNKCAGCMRNDALRIYGNDSTIFKIQFCVLAYQKEVPLTPMEM